MHSNQQKTWSWLFEPRDVGQRRHAGPGLLPTRGQKRTSTVRAGAWGLPRGFGGSGRDQTPLFDWVSLFTPSIFRLD